MKAPRCTDKIMPAEFRPGMRRVKEHAWESWGTDFRYRDGEMAECWISVCTRPLRDGSGICGAEQSCTFKPLPPLPDVPWTWQDGYGERTAELLERFWAVFVQEELRMGREDPASV